MVFYWISYIYVTGIAVISPLRNLNSLVQIAQTRSPLNAVIGNPMSFAVTEYPDALI